MPKKNEILFFKKMIGSFLRIYLIAFQLVIFTSCIQSDSNKKQSDEKEWKSETKHSKYLKIYCDQKGVRIHILHPDIKNQSYKYFIPKNKHSKLPDGYTTLSNKSKSMIVLSSTHIGMLQELKELDRIKGVVSKKYIYNKKIINKISKNQISEFGNEGNPSFEKLLKTKADVLIYSGFTKDYPKSKKLEKAGLICIPNFDWKEDDPLGRAEWILFFGYLTGKKKLAKTYINKLEIEYNKLCLLAKKTKYNPTVFSGNIVGEYWYAPGGKSYMSKLFKDANCDYTYKNDKTVGSIPISFEKIFIQNKNIKFWFNPGINSKKQILKANPKAEFFNSFQNNNIYCYSKNSNKFWELGASHPDWILSDIIQITHSKGINSKECYFYKKVEK